MTKFPDSEMEVSVLLELKEILELEHLLRVNKPLEDFARQYGIKDIYSDSNIKQLQQTLYLGLDYIKGRNSYDAVDRTGHYWELKSLDITGSQKAFSTCSRMSREVCARYAANCRFGFSIYDTTDLQQIYVMDSPMLKPLIDKWSKKLLEKKHLNNPKIPLSFVKEHGYKIFDTTEHPNAWRDPVVIMELLGGIKS